MTMSQQAVRVQVNLLGAWVDPVAREDAISRILEWCRTGVKHYVVTPNLDHCRMLRRDDRLAAAYNQSGLVIPDGWPLIAASCQAAARGGFSVFFLGSTNDTLNGAADVLRSRAPGLKIAGLYSPPFGFHKDEAERDKINALITEARPDIVFVALGAPKQELWMSEHVPSLPIKAALGIGASLDFLAGKQHRAPSVVQAAGLEWLWRALSNPRRLGKRYLACIVSLPELFLDHLKRHLLTKHDTVRQLEAVQPATAV